MTKYTYEIYLAVTKELMAKGTAGECAAQLGFSEKQINSMARDARLGKVKKYIVFRRELERPEVPRILTPDEQAAARSWDAFTAPLRRKYGIKVRRMT